VTEHATPRFLENKVAQATLCGHVAGLCPDAVTRRRCDAADDDVANFTLCMASHHVDQPCRSHLAPLPILLTRSAPDLEHFPSHLARK